jgi:glucokinase
MGWRTRNPDVAVTGFCAIGVDVGGTKTALGLVTFPEGRVRAAERLATRPERSGELILQEVLAGADRLRGIGEAQGLHVGAIGLGVCELVDPEGKVASENLIHWRKLDVRARLSALAPSVVEADVRAAALAEALFGAGRACRSFLYVSVGTGISCCLVLDGKPFTGARGLTGTMASSPWPMACEHCGQPGTQTLEGLAAGPALVAQYRRRGDGRPGTAEEVLACAASGDPIARQVAESAGAALGTAVGHLVNVLDPEAVVIGGGLGLSGGLYWEALLTATRRQIWSELHRGLPLLPAAIGADAGLVGAAAAAWQHYRRVPSPVTGAAH